LHGGIVLARRGGEDNRMNSKQGIWLLISAAAAIAGCMNGALNGDVFDGTGGTTSQQVVGFYGFYNAPNHAVRVQVLKQPQLDPAIDSNWVDVPGSPVMTDAQSIIPDDPISMYEWQLSSKPGSGGLSWPSGGVARVRAQAITKTGAVTTVDADLRVFDDDFDDCQAKHPNASWFEVRDLCGTLYGNRSVANLVSSRTRPSDTLAAQDPSPYLNKPAGGGHGTATGVTYYASNNAYLYYPTLSQFAWFYGFGQGNPTEVRAVYYNDGDLGLGRDMRCLVTQDWLSTKVCMVTNYADRVPGTNEPIFGGNQAHIASALQQAISGVAPVATVAMVETLGLPILFLVYNENGILSPNAKLDRSAHANTEVPKNCMSCHAGKGALINGAMVTGAHFLPFDLDAFEFSGQSGFTQADQLEKFRRLNAIVQDTRQTPVALELLKGWYPPNGPKTSSATFHGEFRPLAWSLPALNHKVYDAVIKKYCRSCHIALDSGPDWSTPKQFTAYSQLIEADICGTTHTMPHALHTQDKFWNSSARAHIIGLLGLKNACKP
jgi:hypothetical protein